MYNKLVSPKLLCRFSSILLFQYPPSRFPAPLYLPGVRSRDTDSCFPRAAGGGGNNLSPPLALFLPPSRFFHHGGQQVRVLLFTKLHRHLIFGPLMTPSPSRITVYSSLHQLKRDESGRRSRFRKVWVLLLFVQEAAAVVCSVPVSLMAGEAAFCILTCSAYPRLALVPSSPPPVFQETVKLWEALFAHQSVHVHFPPTSLEFSFIDWNW